ncbi:GNAT family N-acetyltransferase [Gottschalkia acidurici]|nr:GNAT family N-acetyltransferase [Gottschalkia acidurici]
MTVGYETERLELKVLDESYGELVLDYYERNREFLREWEPERKEIFYSLNLQKNQLSRDLKDIKDYKLLRLWIFKKNDYNRVIGNIAFSNIIRGVFLSCNLGYKLDKDETNNGYITEAINKGIEIIFNEYGLHRIEANIMPRNKRSIRVVEKLGFQNEGLAHKYLKINGKWEDHIHMILLNDKII